MVCINDSLGVVLLGDWNRLYIQPEWIAEQVFGENEMEIRVNGQGAEFGVSYACKGVNVQPSQSRIIFSADDTREEVLEYLAGCLNRFLQKAMSPQARVYGLNVEFVEEEAMAYAAMLDSMSDAEAYVDLEYEILSTQINRSLKKADAILSIEMRMEEKQLIVHFNEEHRDIGTETEFSGEQLRAFIQECSRVLERLGYGMEGEV